MSKETWELHSEGWNKNLFYSEDNFFIKWFLNVAKKSDKILDQGTGVGQYAFTFCRAGYKNVVGMDFSEELIKIATQNNKKLGFTAKFVEGDIRKMPFKNEEFDISVSGGIIEHVPETKLTLKELKRVTKIGGYLIIHVPHRISLFTITKFIQKAIGVWKCGYEKSFTKKNFEKMLGEEGFEIIKYHLNPFKSGKKNFPGIILEALDKPLHAIGLGGHHIAFLCKRKI